MTNASDQFETDAKRLNEGSSGSDRAELPEMEPLDVDGAELEVYDSGSGEPVVFVHGGGGDECFAVLQEPALAERYRLIHYHRRGWGDSASTGLPLSIEEQAADCHAVMQHVGIDRAHVAGLSYGGIIVLQFAVDFPDAVQTLALMEPAVPQVLDESPEYHEWKTTAAPLLEDGEMAAGLDTFFQGICGREYAAAFDRTLPAGWFERWVDDSDTLFQYDAPAMDAWEFTEADAAQIDAPVLNVTAADTAAPFKEIHETVQSWLPHAERAVVPDATHCMLEINPTGSAEALSEFFSQHPMDR
ncbi:alpha/beta fold hydrolase [Natronobeatus ordinarius]|uniref:alpha/beta fold hydrolase n=1 Tax=Natronobeatus ordinarius TaxID=2963433 RepID=UPI0020CE0D89|nr:alpha/beta hydrolase [Natronobeatus ordinarius]